MRLPHSPIGALMTEHRLIERMLAVMTAEEASITSTGEVDATRVESICTFLSVYADRNHHGKEEDILFRRLAEKDLAPEHRQAMQGLIDGHAWAREQVVRIRKASGRSGEGDTNAAEEIADSFHKLAAFYPEHIEEEDHRFFKPAIGYFSKEERDEMERQFEEFDRSLLHALYEEKLVALEAAGNPQPVTM